LARHRTEIWSAVRELPPRQRDLVYLRFWRDMTLAEMVREGYFGYEPRPLWQDTRGRGAKANLAASLAHLVSAA
jgi:hypothetical protein